MAESDLTGIPRFNLSLFRSQFRNNKGITHPSHFLVRINLPQEEVFSQGPLKATQIVGDPLDSSTSQANFDANVQLDSDLNDLKDKFSGTENLQRDLMFLCDSVQLPGRAINTTQFRSYGQPNTFSQSVWADNSLTISIITRRQLLERKFFQDWQNKAVDFGTGDVNYFNQYAGSVDVLKYDVNGYIEARYVYEEAFPIQISQEQLSWSSSNEILKTNVSFAFRQWKQIPVKVRQESVFGVFDPRTIVGDVGNII